MFPFEALPLRDAFVCRPTLVRDARGSFIKTYEQQAFADVSFTVSECLQSVSERGVLRGLHFQTDQPQAKLVYACAGEVYDVIADLRKESPTFGKWQGVLLTPEKLLYVPRGFAHGYYVLSESAVVSYLCDGAYSPETDTGIRWNDPDLGIEWPIREGEEPILSERDRNLPWFRDAQGL